MQDLASFRGRARAAAVVLAVLLGSVGSAGAGEQRLKVRGSRIEGLTRLSVLGHRRTPDTRLSLVRSHRQVTAGSDPDGANRTPSFLHLAAQHGLLSIAGPTSFAALEQRLQEAAGRGPHLSLYQIGTSIQGRPIHAVRLNRSSAVMQDPQVRDPQQYTALVYAEQHGLELGGGEAQLAFLELVSWAPWLIPTSLDLWLIPRVNPDGVEAYQRRNAAGKDLNRDHHRGRQPETRALHAAIAAIAPDVALDCHEFYRNPADYRQRGWQVAEHIAIDPPNHPLLPEPLRQLGQQWTAHLSAAIHQAGFRAGPYRLGDPPPGKVHRGTTSINNAKDAVAAHGIVSLLIEGGTYELGSAAEEHATLSERVAHYLPIFDALVAGEELWARTAAYTRRWPELPGQLPSQYGWGRSAPEALIPVELAGGAIAQIPTTSYFDRIEVVEMVPAPHGYLIAPGAAPTYRPMLDLHRIGYQRLDRERSYLVEPLTLSGNAVQLEAGAQLTAPAGSLYVPLTQDAALRAALFLDPALPDNRDKKWLRQQQRDKVSVYRVLSPIP